MSIYKKDYVKEVVILKKFIFIALFLIGIFIISGCTQELFSPTMELPKDRIRLPSNPDCIDPDGGLNLYEKTTCTDIYGGNMTDGCISGGSDQGFLREISCDDRGNGLRCQMNDIQCPNGEMCSNGKWLMV